MKSIKIILLVSVLGIYSCKKDKEEAPPKRTSPIGYWKGLYGTGTNPQTQNYSWLFRSNGTIRVYSQAADTTGGSKAEGTYSVSGTIITNSYTYISGPLTGTFSTNSAVDANFQTLTGTYGSGTATSGGGTFTLTFQ